MTQKVLTKNGFVLTKNGFVLFKTPDPLAPVFVSYTNSSSGQWSENSNVAETISFDLNFSNNPTNYILKLERPSVAGGGFFEVYNGSSNVIDVDVDDTIKNVMGISSGLWPLAHTVPYRVQITASNSVGDDRLINSINIQDNVIENWQLATDVSLLFKDNNVIDQNERIGGLGGDVVSSGSNGEFISNTFQFTLVPTNSFVYVGNTRLSNSSNPDLSSLWDFQTPNITNDARKETKIEIYTRNSGSSNAVLLKSFDLVLMDQVDNIYDPSGNYGDIGGSPFNYEATLHVTSSATSIKNTAPNSNGSTGVTVTLEAAYDINDGKEISELTNQGIIISSGSNSSPISSGPYSGSWPGGEYVFSIVGDTLFSTGSTYNVSFV